MSVPWTIYHAETPYDYTKDTGLLHCTTNMDLYYLSKTCLYISMFTVLLFTIFQHNNRIKIKNYFSMIEIYTAIHSFCIILITLTVNICMKINNASVGNDLIVSTCSPYMELSLHNHYTPLVFFPEVTWYCNTRSTNRTTVYLQVRNVGTSIIAIPSWMNRTLNKTLSLVGCK